MIIFIHFHIDFMIDFIETHVEFILEFLHVLFPLDGESFWPRNSTHPVTRPNAFVVLTPCKSEHIAGDVVQGRNIKQAAKSRLKSTRENLLQKAMDTVGPQGNEL